MILPPWWPAHRNGYGRCGGSFILRNTNVAGFPGAWSTTNRATVRALFIGYRPAA